MKGDFSRSTFDPHKHYTSVRMQQGRVQLDADWNEQADILLRLITTQLQDLLGPGSTSGACPGFAITLVEQAEEPVDQDQVGQPEESTAPSRTLPDFQIGAGRYYVDGILCENEATVLFSEQPDYPGAKSLVQAPVDYDRWRVYLDVWQRHITAIEDPAIREIALGGPDTTTRIKTVWQVKLLPAPGDPADDQDWEAFVARTTDKGWLKAQWDKEKGAFVENHLYRVEIHSVAGDEATFKWSRENGSVVFPIREKYLQGEEYLFTWEDVPGNDNERLLSYLREDLALEWAEGSQISISKSEDGKAIRIGAWAEIVLDTGEKTATLKTSDGKQRVLKVRQENGKRRIYSRIVELNLEGLDRDLYQLDKSNWVEIVDDVTVLNGRPLPLCRVKELDGQDGKVVIWADEESAKRIIAEMGDRELQHPLLRRWEDDAKPITPHPDTTAGQGETWLDLENGIQVAFSDTGTYQVGNYWLIPARTRSEHGIEWPQKHGRPEPRSPHGIVHHFAPLALLQFEDGEWSLVAEESMAFRNLPQLTANLSATRDYLEKAFSRLDKVQETVDTMVKQMHVLETVTSEESLEKGDLVSLDPAAVGRSGTNDPGTELAVKLASSKDRGMVVGVVWESIDPEGDGKRYRVVLHGRVRCKVIGRVEPGDLLVPSPEPGYAQKRGQFLRMGTIVGKALSFAAFDEGLRTGTVDMLVTLG